MSKILLKLFGLLKQNSTSNTGKWKDLENGDEKFFNESRSSIFKPPRDDAINTLLYIISYFFLFVYI